MAHGICKAFDSATPGPLTRGWCQACYAWSRRNDWVDPTGRRRIRKRYEVTKIIEEAAYATVDECIILTGHTSRPNVRVGGVTMFVSRAVWITRHGVPDTKIEVLHTCNGGSGASGCINIQHLYLGTVLDNRQDAARAGRYKGVANGRARLDEKDVRAIRARVKFGETRAALAREYGIHVTTVKSLVRRKTWAWLD